MLEVLEEALGITIFSINKNHFINTKGIHAWRTHYTLLWYLSTAKHPHIAFREL
jgi:hypothetical protein